VRRLNSISEIGDCGRYFNGKYSAETPTKGTGQLFGMNSVEAGLLTCP